MMYIYCLALGAFIGSMITQIAMGTTPWYSFLTLTLAPIYYIVSWIVTGTLWAAGNIQLAWYRLTLLNKRLD